MSPNLQDTIRALIDEAILMGDTIAAQFQVLPVFADLGGVLALDENCSVFVILHDQEPKPANSADIQLAYAIAADRHDQLRSLRPPTDPSASHCPLCRGDGTVYNIRCGTCFGLGKIPVAQTHRATR